VFQNSCKPAFCIVISAWKNLEKLNNNDGKAKRIDDFSVTK
jgi:hypothetical protein